MPPKCIVTQNVFGTRHAESSVVCVAPRGIQKAGAEWKLTQRRVAGSLI